MGYWNHVSIIEIMKGLTHVIISVTTHVMNVLSRKLKSATSLTFVVTWTIN